MTRFTMEKSVPFSPPTTARSDTTPSAMSRMPATANAASVPDSY